MKYLFTLALVLLFTTSGLSVKSKLIQIKVKVQKITKNNVYLLFQKQKITKKRKDLLEKKYSVGDYIYINIKDSELE